MDVKPAAWGLACAVIATFGAVVVYAIDIEVVKRDKRMARQEAHEEESLLKKTRDSLIDLKIRETELLEQRATLEAVTAKNAELRRKVDERRAAWHEARGRFAGEVERARQFAREKQFPTLTLQNGEVLKQVRFKAIQDEKVLLDHATGITKVPLNRMPEELAGRLALGWNPVLPPELEDPAKQVAVAVEEAETVPALTETAGAVKTSSDGMDQKIKELEQKIFSLVSKIQAATHTRSEHERVFLEYSEKYNNARMMGRSNSHNVKRDAARRQMDVLDRQMSEAQLQVHRLKSELIQLQSGQP